MVLFLIQAGEMAPKIRRKPLLVIDVASGSNASAANRDLKIQRIQVFKVPVHADALLGSLHVRHHGKHVVEVLN